MTRDEAIKRAREIIDLFDAGKSLECGSVTVANHEFCRTVETLETAIKALEQPEIIRCAGCHYYADGHCDMHHMATDPIDFCSYAVGR